MNEIWEHLERVRGGQWVHGKPALPGEVCAAYRIEREADYFRMRPVASWQSLRLIEAVATELYPERMGPNDGIGQFNDHPDTTRADVEAVLEKAAIRLDEVVE